MHARTHAHTLIFSQQKHDAFSVKPSSFIVRASLAFSPHCGRPCPPLANHTPSPNYSSPSIYFCSPGSSSFTRMLFSLSFSLSLFPYLFPSLSRTKTTVYATPGETTSIIVLVVARYKSYARAYGFPSIYDLHHSTSFYNVQYDVVCDIYFYKHFFSTAKM